MQRLWSDRNISKLISCIEDNRFYWDPRDSDYYTQSKRDELIRQFSEETGIPEHEVRCKWRNLRGHFGREWRRRNGTSNWYLYDKLKFLEDSVFRRRRFRTVSDSSSSENSQDDAEDKHTMKKKKSDTEQEDLLQTASATLAALTDRIQDQDTVDEFSAFSHLIAEELRTEQNPQVVAFAKFKISEILYQRATGQLVPPDTKPHTLPADQLPTEHYS